MQEKLVSSFFSNELPSYASYDNLRKIASYIDGMKISARKIIYTLLDKYPGTEKTKTDTVANICAAYTNYLHGAANLTGVCNTLTQSFVSANNYALLVGNSSGFGTRINPTCAASRYTKVALSPIVEELLNKDDKSICGNQFFEGTTIEPKFFMPVFPILFLNGSHGLSTGYSQDIYPRNPEEVLKYIRNSLNEKKSTVKLLPWFKGFKGKIEVNPETSKIECFGVVEKNNMTTYTITELPIGIEYQKYIEILDKLCDNNTITDYTDYCDTKTDTIKFEVRTTRAFTKEYNEERKVYEVLKLIKTLPEVYNCIDENNRVKEFKSIKEILDDFIKIRLNYYSLRKDYLLNKTTDQIKYLKSKYTFCNAIVTNKLQISNVKKDIIIENLEKIKNIIKINDSYDYLLNMPIHSISLDTLTKLKNDRIKQEDFYKEIEETTPKDMWLKDLANFEKELKKY